MLTTGLDADVLGGFEGATVNQALAGSVGLGDVNGDGVDDLALVAAQTAYLFLGPVDQDGIENVADAADIVIDLASLGAIAQSSGDFNGDGRNDLAFVNRATGLVTVLTNLNDAPRVLDSGSIAGLPATSRFTIQLDANALGTGQVSLHALNWDGDDKSDLLVVTHSPIGNTVGHIFGGSDITDMSRTAGVPLALSAAIGVLSIGDDDAGRLALATQLLNGFTPSINDITTVHAISARVIGDADGDGRDDIVIADAGFLHFENGLAGIPDAGRTYLLSQQEVNGGAKELGFTSAKAGVNGVIIADLTPQGRAANPYQLGRDADLSLVVADWPTPVNFTVTAAATSDNTTFADLAADIEAAFIATGEASGNLDVTESADGRIVLSYTFPLNFALNLPGLAEQGPAIDLRHDSARIWQGFALGGPVSVVGDLNDDGFDEIAFARNVEGGTWATGSLFIVSGGVDLGEGALFQAPSDDADFVFMRPDAAGLSVGTGYATAPTATAGDFDADGRIDLAVGITANVLQTPFSVIDADERGEVFVFWGVGERAGTLSLDGTTADANGDFHLLGESGGDRFGSLGATPNQDLNGDDIADLVIGASDADAFATGLRAGAGKIYVLHGAARGVDLPDTFIELGNRQITGSGLFLVDRGLGRAEVFSGTDDFLLAAGSDNWYRFTTQGDGNGNSLIELLPAHEDSAFSIRATSDNGLTPNGGGFGVQTPGSAVVAGETRQTFLIGGVDDDAVVYEFDLASLLEFTGDDVFFTDIELVLPLLQPASADAQFSIGVLAAEGDGAADAGDGVGELLLSATVDVAAGASEIVANLSTAIRAVLAESHTRMALRIEAPVGVQQPELTLLSDSVIGAGAPRLDVVTNVQGVVGDLYDADGRVLSEGRSIISMRDLAAGTYFLKVYSTDPSAGDIDLTIEVRAPIAGETHASDGEPDRDTISGDEGEDVIVGNDGLDRLIGGSGVDRFVGETIEIRDFDALNETRAAPVLAENSNRTQFEADPIVEIADPALKGLIANALGFNVTYGADGAPVVHGDIHASDLATLVRLNASGAGIESLRGLEAAIGLRALTLGSNPFGYVDTTADPLDSTKWIGALEPLAPSRADNGDLVGLLNIKALSLDFDVVTHIVGYYASSDVYVAPPTHFLGEMTSLNYLSMDGTLIAGGFAPEPFADVTFNDGLKQLTNLKFLSIDSPEAQASTISPESTGLRTSKCCRCTPTASPMCRRWRASTGCVMST